MIIDNLAPQYLYKLKSLPRGKDFQGTITNNCNLPHNSILVDPNLNCFICDCDGLLPIPVGQVSDFKSFDEVWNSPISKILQQDIDDKKFTWCAIEQCGIKHWDCVKQHITLTLTIDESCNLACPSCRRNPIMIQSGPEYEKKLRAMETILTWLELCNDPITIFLGGSGDPLASSIIRSLFKTYQPKPNQKFVLNTNGLLLKKQLNNSKVLPNVSRLNISVDAASESVYSQVRVGGSWSVLLENFEFIKDNGFASRTNLNFALQKNNYRDLLKFGELCVHYGFSAQVHQIDDWATWVPQPVTDPDPWTIRNGTFADHNILSPTHPEFAQCKETVLEFQHQFKDKRLFVHPSIVEKIS
jgi:pyruvate-formate lyase-activating enzyme